MIHFEPTASLLCLCLLIIGVLIIVNLLFAPKNSDLEKLSPYECGFAPVHAQTRTPFTVQYYLVALLFLAFDLEIIVLFPLGGGPGGAGGGSSWLSDYNYWVVTLFYSVLSLGFVYELGKGVIEYTKSSRLTKVGAANLMSTQQEEQRKK